MSAAGYAISDYFDKKYDPNSGAHSSKTLALYFLFCAAGISLGSYATWKAGLLNLIIVYVFVAIVLWMYSAVYKRQVLIGNIVIAMLSALVPLSVLLDIPPIYSFYSINLNFVVFWIFCLAIFIFATMFSFDIIKDIEEFESDINYDKKTLPFVMGDRFTKQTIIAINATIIAMIFFVYFRYEMFFANISKYFSLIYILLLLVIPLIYISWKVYKATTGNDYRMASNVLKLVMWAGVVYSGLLF